jgi:hypothetical protein
MVAFLHQPDAAGELQKRWNKAFGDKCQQFREFTPARNDKARVAGTRSGPWSRETICGAICKSRLSMLSHD